MPFIRRFTSQPSIETLLQIEAIDIVDLPPQAPATGVGSGTLLVCGEFEDGNFAAGGDAAEFDRTRRNKGPEEVIGANLATVYGGFGFTYGTVPYSNPCARRHLFELWNGNGFLKLKFIRTLRLMIARVDTSVGEVALSPRASILGDPGPYVLAVGEQLTFTTDTGGPTASTAIAAVEAISAGAVFVASGFVGGESIKATIDGGPQVTVVFAATDQTPAQVAAKINLVLGYTAAVVNAGAVDIHGIQKGTGGSVVLVDGSPGALAAIGQVAGTTPGTGNVANLVAVTAAEVATIINGTVALAAINVAASVDSDGAIRFTRSGGPGTILLAASPMATAIGATPTGTVITAGQHGAGTIPAGTRVRTAGGLEWVTCQTLQVAAGTSAAPNVGPHTVKVRPATDDGTAVGTGASTVTVLVDQPSFAQMAVTNPNALTAALTEPQMDVRYQAALDATLDPSKVTRQANYLVVARRSDTIDRIATQNAVDASAAGFFGRKYNARAPLGFTETQALADVALHRVDRDFYTYPGWQVLIPEIATRGAAGGLGFTEDGVITVAGDGPLAMINCLLNPEENPGQATGLIEAFFDVEPVGVLTQDDYIAFKAAGICAPRRDADDGSIYQSGVTRSITPGLTTQARRKMDDFITDSLARLLGPYSKKLATLQRRDGARTVIESFLAGLQSKDNPSLQRIDSFLVSEAAQTPELTALGIFIFQVKVRLLSSMDVIVIQAEIGEGVITVESGT